jgi:hypothetical protein
MQRTILRELGIVSALIVLISISVLIGVYIARAKQNPRDVLTNQTTLLISHAHLIDAASVQ